MKEETERRCKELQSSQSQDLEQRVTQVQEQVNQWQSTQKTTSVASIWSQPPVEGPISHPTLRFLLLVVTY